MHLPRLHGRVAVIGDVHAEDALLERALRFVAAEGVTGVLCTGDVVDGPGSVDRCCDLLRAERASVVRGNHDRWANSGHVRQLPHATDAATLSDRSRDLLSKLPVTLEFESSVGRVLLCHGIGPDDMAKVAPDDESYALDANLPLQRLLRDGTVSVVVNGHSHRRMVRTISRLTIVNAGTLYRVHEPGFMILDFDAGNAEWFTVAGSGDVAPGERWPFAAGSG